MATPSALQDKDRVTAEKIYAVLFDRFKMNTDILWRVVALVLATQAGLYVGLTNLDAQHNALQIVSGSVLYLLGITGPLSVRFIESVIMIDRLRLDELENELLREPGLEMFRLRHGMRFRLRLHDFYGRATAEQKNVIDKRRVGTVDEDTRIDSVLDTLGQASLIWTFLMSVAGVVGLLIALNAVVMPFWLHILCGVLISIVPLSIWWVTHGWPQKLVGRIMFGLMRAVDFIRK